jgi:magnesium-transporting ATPase (P-type)
MSKGATHNYALLYLDSLNVAQDRDQNKQCLERMGGVEPLGILIYDFLRADIYQMQRQQMSSDAQTIFSTGLQTDQVNQSRAKFGENTFPASRMDSFLQLLVNALTDSTLLILIAAATVALIIGPGYLSQYLIGSP